MMFRNTLSDIENSPKNEVADNLLKIVNRLLAANDAAHITLGEIGEIIIFPHQRAYLRNVVDMPKFCMAQAPEYQLTKLSPSSSEPDMRAMKNIHELLWEISFYLHHDRLIESCSENDVIEFKRWPNLTRLPSTPNAARICALLTRNPTSITLIRRKLGIDKNEVNQVVSAAYASGIVNTISHGPALAAVKVSTDTNSGMGNATPAKSGLWQSLFAKISSL